MEIESYIENRKKTLKDNIKNLIGVNRYRVIDNEIKALNNYLGVLLKLGIIDNNFASKEIEKFKEETTQFYYH